MHKARIYASETPAIRPSFLPCQQVSVAFPFSTCVFTPRIKEELVSIKYPRICQTVNSGLHVFEALSVLFLLRKKEIGDDLFLCSCYHDGQTLTDLQIPQGVIFLTASKSVFSPFLNITHCSNKKQVWDWNITSTHH